jgi:hypothetical protein
MTPENTANIRYDRADMAAILTEFHVAGPVGRALILDAYETKRTEGKDQPCQATVFHGPGHQSSTFCQGVGGEAGHDTVTAGDFDPSRPEGALVHHAVLPSGGYTEWVDSDPYAQEY